MAKKLTDLQKKTLAHYDKMIRWAKKQKPRSFVREDFMECEISHTWHSSSCPYCEKYFDGGLECKRCPLDPTKKLGEFNCCNGLWNEMATSGTWGKWIEAALKVRQYIKQNGAGK